MPKKGKPTRGAVVPVVGTVADNLKRLMLWQKSLVADKNPQADERLCTLVGLEAYIRAMVESGRWPDAITVGKSSLQRMREAENGVGIDIIESVARAYELHARQLLVPKLDPSNPPYYAATAVEKDLSKDLQALRARLASVEKAVSGDVDRDRHPARPKGRQKARRTSKA
jgi:hypothetical protein